MKTKKDLGEIMREEVRRQCAEGNIRVELQGLLIGDFKHEYGLLVDKSKYLVRFVETEETLKILIEPKVRT